MANRLTPLQRRENAARRERANDVLKFYAKRVGASADCPLADQEITLVDMVADLMHAFGHGKNLDTVASEFDLIYSRARMHFEAERKGEI